MIRKMAIDESKFLEREGKAPRKSLLENIASGIVVLGLLGGIYSGGTLHQIKKERTELSERGYHPIDLIANYEDGEREQSRVMIYDAEAFFTGSPEDFEAALDQKYRDLGTLKLSTMDKSGWTPVMKKIEELTAMLNAYRMSNPENGSEERAKEWLRQNPIFLDPLKYVDNSGINIMGTKIVHRTEVNGMEQTNRFDIVNENGDAVSYVLDTSPEDWYWDGKLVEGVMSKN